MERDITSEECERHDALMAKASALIDGRLFAHGTAMRGFRLVFSGWPLRRAAKLYKQALEIAPNNWAAMWLLGKIYQRFGDHATAFDWFYKAHALVPDQVDVLREAGVEALEIGLTDGGLALCRAAVALAPDDAGLLCNLALAHCMAGQDADAERCAAEAVERDPTDKVSVFALERIRDVATGRRPRPGILAELTCKLIE